jgi:CRP/FNR family transcriptional regulator, cyclic AMP receptor protein
MSQRPARGFQPLPLTIVRPGHVAVAQGALGTGVTVVGSGLLWASAVADDGSRLVLDVLGPGDAVGEPDGVASPCEVRAAGPVRLRPVRGEEAERAIAARQARAVALALDLAFLDSGTRIQRRLADLATRIGLPSPTGIRIPLILTQDDLAGMAATSRETVNRVVRRLRRDGSIEIERRGRYVVRPPLRLVGG